MGFLFYLLCGLGKRIAGLLALPLFVIIFVLMLPVIWVCTEYDEYLRRRA